MIDKLILWRYDRQAVKRYAHMTAWRPCYRSFRRTVCFRCFWREITGRDKRDQAARAARSARIRLLLEDHQ